MIERWRRRALSALVWACTFVLLLDFYATWRWVVVGGKRENNPVARWLMEMMGAEQFIVAGVLAVITARMLFWRFWRWIEGRTVFGIPMRIWLVITLALVTVGDFTIGVKSFMHDYHGLAAELALKCREIWSLLVGESP